MHLFSTSAQTVHFYATDGTGPIHPKEQHNLKFIQNSDDINGFYPNNCRKIDFQKGPLYTRMIKFHSKFNSFIEKLKLDCCLTVRFVYTFILKSEP